MLEKEDVKEIPDPSTGEPEPEPDGTPAAEPPKPEKTVPYERFSEVVGKQRQAEAELAQMREEIQAIRESSGGKSDDEYDPDTGWTYGQRKAQEKLMQEKALEAQRPVVNLLVEEKIERQRDKLESMPKFKKFFESKKYTEELDDALAKMTVQTAITPNIVEQYVKYIIGSHVEDFTKDAEDRGRKRETETRQIEGELDLGKSSIQVEGKRIVLNDDMKDLVRNGLTAEDAYEVITKRDKRREKKG